MNLDLIIFQSLNGLAGKWPALDCIGIFFAEYFQYVLAGVLLFFLFYPKEKRKRNRLMVIASLGSALTARFAVKAIFLLFFSRPRPYMVLESARKLIPTWSGEDFQSFPSGHALFFFALAAAIWGFDKKLGTAFFGAAALICVARIYAGAHWPSDIVIGAITGTIVGFMIYRILATQKATQRFDLWETNRLS
jgi:undecaprenyl-diphosphatase